MANLGHTIKQLSSGHASAGKPVSGQQPISQESKAKLSKRALEIYAATNPVTQNDDSEPKPIAQL